MIVQQLKRGGDVDVSECVPGICTQVEGKGDNTVSGIWNRMGDVDPEEIWVSGILRLRR